MKTTSQFPLLHSYGSLSYRILNGIGSLSCRCSGSLSTTIYYIFGGRGR